MTRALAELTQAEKDAIRSVATAVYGASFADSNQWRGIHPNDALRAAVDLVDVFGKVGLIDTRECGDPESP